jgi:hypothetical protein
VKQFEQIVKQKFFEGHVLVRVLEEHSPGEVVLVGQEGVWRQIVSEWKPSTLPRRKRRQPQLPRDIRAGFPSREYLGVMVVKAGKRAGAMEGLKAIPFGRIGTEVFKPSVIIV